MVIYVYNVNIELKVGGVRVWGILGYRGWFYIKRKIILYKRNIILCNDYIIYINL